MSSITESVVQYISPAPGEFVAYRQSPGKTPGVVFLPGLMSNMDGTKAMALERYCRSIGHSYVRFDYRGHGFSSGTSQECTIGMRKEDVLTILDNVTKGMLCFILIHFMKERNFYSNCMLPFQHYHIRRSIRFFRSDSLHSWCFCWGKLRSRASGEARPLAFYPNKGTAGYRFDNVNEHFRCCWKTEVTILGAGEMV